MAKARLPKLKISLKDIAYLIGIGLPMLAAQWPAAKESLEEFGQTDPEVHALMETLKDLHERLTT